ncbi:LPXTG cell wall anchor domain-containing protein [Timonella sp. A28]|uniref:LPXTG cell wall anchor domain-containing protein n=1 Tax=Timonella sp. A28 TaxID=3442640 RepID=UPI003EBCC9F1
MSNQHAGRIRLTYGMAAGIVVAPLVAASLASAAPVNPPEETSSTASSASPNIEASQTVPPAEPTTPTKTQLPWPGPEGMVEFDESNTFTGDMSSAVYESKSVVWAVSNGEGILHKMDVFPNRVGEAKGWVGGHKLRYPDGTGNIDAEGVVLVGGAAKNGVLVGSERNTEVGAPKASRPSVLLYDVNPVGIGTGDIQASHEWNLSEHYPNAAPNSGIEGITWVPSADLVAAGVIDESTKAPYTPDTYTNHVEGIAFVGVEATGTVIGYALGLDGSITRVTSFDSAFAGVMELEYDTVRNELWVVCDEVCEGRSQVFALGGAESTQSKEETKAAQSSAYTEVGFYERPAKTENLANEGFAISPATVNGTRQVLWTDDAATGGHSFRVGALKSSEADSGTDSGTDGGTGGSTEETPAEKPKPEEPKPSQPDNGTDGSDTGSDGTADGSSTQQPQPVSDNQSDGNNGGEPTLDPTPTADARDTSKKPAQEPTVPGAHGSNPSPSAGTQGDTVEATDRGGVLAKTGAQGVAFGIAGLVALGLIVSGFFLLKRRKA